MELFELVCVECGTTFIVGRCCYRGQVYCSPACRQEGRKRILEAAGEKYAASTKGRTNHQERQNRYRKEKKGENRYEEAREIKVTHPTSAQAASEAIIQEGTEIPVEQPSLRDGCACRYDTRSTGREEAERTRSISPDEMGSSPPRCSLCGAAGRITRRELRPGSGQRGFWILVYPGAGSEADGS